MNLQDQNYNLFMLLDCKTYSLCHYYEQLNLYLCLLTNKTPKPKSTSTFQHKRVSYFHSIFLKILQYFKKNIELEQQEVLLTDYYFPYKIWCQKNNTTISCQQEIMQYYEEYCILCCLKMADQSVPKRHLFFRPSCRQYFQKNVLYCSTEKCFTNELAWRCGDPALLKRLIMSLPLRI